MTHQQQFQSALGSGGMTPSDVKQLASVCGDWFAANPTPATLSLHAILGGLARDWDDPQGVPTNEYQIFKQGLLSDLQTVGTAPTVAQLDAAVASLVVAYRDCCQITGQSPVLPHAIVRPLFRPCGAAARGAVCRFFKIPMCLRGEFESLRAYFLSC